MSAVELSADERKRKLKEMIEKLHKGVPPEQVKEQFKQIVAGVDPEDIARVEEELIREGMPREEIRRLCDVHLQVFEEALQGEKPLAPPDHPVGILMEEHRMLLEFAEGLMKVLAQLKGADESAFTRSQIDHLHHVVKHFKESEKHYLREENVLFPYIEKHGVTEPPKIMWMEHDEIRSIKKALYAIADDRRGAAVADWAKRLMPEAKRLADMLTSHFNKENNILFPTAMKLISESEWAAISKEFEEVGYCCFTPPRAKAVAAPEPEAPSAPVSEGDVAFKTGRLTVEELNAILNTLPVDISYVGKDDTVRYYSDNRDRIFVRTTAVLGRKVQQCHPQKSLHVVEQILSDFREGKRGSAEFWIDLHGRMVYIRYFPVRSPSGEYLGCLEVTQDITEIRKIQGEKRLL
ncbi:MAG: DUF438 domain-containing protein [Thermoplasmata archaeon]